MNDEQIRELAGRLDQALAAAQEPVEVMRLKFQMEVASSKLYLVLGWMLRDERIRLIPSEYGYRVEMTRDSRSRSDTQIAVAA
ncbi:MAG: hypothetical protein HY547_02640 [Elusimicrobia bacterium]|nr:hypothetical protein [Elusimicrobiota bacterium]